MTDARAHSTAQTPCIRPEWIASSLSQWPNMRLAGNVAQQYFRAVALDNMTPLAMVVDVSIISYSVVISSPTIASRTRFAIILPDFPAIAIFKHLCFALRMSDPHLPEVFKNPEIAVLPSGGGPVGWDLGDLTPGIPMLTLIERRGASGRKSDSIVEGGLRGQRRFVLVTRKSTFFNYLPASAIGEKLGIDVTVTDTSDVLTPVAQALQAKHGLAWDGIGKPEQARLRGYAEQILAEQVAPALTPELLLERRAKGEVGRWLDAIKRLTPR